MRLVNSSVEILPQDPGFQGVLEMIETAGRTCYKSEGTLYFHVDKENYEGDDFDSFIERISSDKRLSVKKGPSFDPTYYVSIPHKCLKEYPEFRMYFIEEQKGESPYYENVTAKDFVEMLKNRNHGAALEHGTIYLYSTYDISSIEGWENSIAKKYSNNKFSVVKYDDHSDIRGIYITTNLRTIIENNWIDDLKYLCEPTEYHERRVTVRFICSRAIANEIVRHRVFSYCQESTRYCNYALDRFDSNLLFIKPEWLKKVEGFLENLSFFDYFKIETFKNKVLKWAYLKGLEYSEQLYLTLIKAGALPQEARGILPLDLKTELVMTGFKSDFDHFFDLRCAKSAHPDIRVLANDLKEQISEL